jgi:hypothetical protein
MAASMILDAERCKFELINQAFEVVKLHYNDKPSEEEMYFEYLANLELMIHDHEYLEYLLD